MCAWSSFSKLPSNHSKYFNSNSVWREPWEEAHYSLNACTRNICECVQPTQHTELRPHPLAGCSCRAQAPPCAHYSLNACTRNICECAQPTQHTELRPHPLAGLRHFHGHITASTHARAIYVNVHSQHSQHRAKTTPTCRMDLQGSGTSAGTLKPRHANATIRPGTGSSAMRFTKTSAAKCTGKMIVLGLCTWLYASTMRPGTGLSAMRFTKASAMKRTGTMSV